MKFREAAAKIPGMRFIADSISVKSAIGRYCLMESTFTTDSATLENTFKQIREIIDFLTQPDSETLAGEISLELEKVNDIRNSLSRLSAGETLDDTELFEIKGLSRSVRDLKILYQKSGLHDAPAFHLPDTEPVIACLDPENTDNSHFHIYDCYSQTLSEKRKALREIQKKKDYDENESDRLTAECMLLEEEIRVSLSADLKKHSSSLTEALKKIGEADVLFAKGELALQFNLCIPEISDDFTTLRGLRYLPVEENLRIYKKEFQPVDITLHRGVTLITGTNMGGKTITLKSVGLAQAMTQFGFCLPAAEARIMPVEEICLLMEDLQSARSGLSSFGSEILNIQRTLRKAAEGEKLLILMDEPGRTTNPDEGSAIANAVIEILGKSESVTLVTSHFSNLISECRRLKVKGIKESAFDAIIGSPMDLVPYIDYSLIEAEQDTHDREALRISRLLGIDENFLNMIEKNL